MEHEVTKPLKIDVRGCEDLKSYYPDYTCCEECHKKNVLFPAILNKCVFRVCCQGRLWIMDQKNFYDIK